MTTMQIDQLIERTSRSLMRTRVAGLSLHAVGVVVVAVYVAVVLDAALGLNVYGLLALDLAIIAVAWVVTWPVMKELRRGRQRDRDIARAIEDRLSIADNPLINAVDLSVQNDPGTSAALRDAAIDRGEKVAQDVEPADVIDRAPLRHAGQFVGFVLVSVVIFYITLPGVFHAVLPRLVAPFADYPPYTTLRFEVRVEPVRAYVGKPAEIRVALRGPDMPGRASVVFIDDNPTSPGLPMYRDTRPAQDPLTAPPQDSAERYTLRIDQVDSDRRFYIDTPRGRSRLFKLIVDRSPLIEGARVTLKYPAYTGWPDATQPLTGRAIRGLAGTRVDIHVDSNVPVGGGELRVTGTKDADQTRDLIEPVTPNPIDPHIAGAGFTLEQSGKFKLSLVGQNGEPGAEAIVGEVRVLPDRLPKVDVVDPDRQVVVPEGWDVDVSVGVGDDIAVSGAEVHVGVNDQPTREAPLNLSYPDTDKTAGYADHQLTPRALGASAGDIIKYYAAARDNRPGTPQSAETPVHYVHVITMQQYMDLARSQYRVEDMQQEFEAIQEQLAELAALREAMLEAIEALQAEAGEGGTLTDQQQTSLKTLQAGLNNYADLSGSLAQDLTDRAGQASLYEFEEPYKAMLNKLSEQLQAQAEQSQTLAEAMKAMGSGDTSETRRAVAQAAEQFAAMDEPFDRAASSQSRAAEQDLEKLALASAMIREGERIRRVAMEQAELTVRMSGLAGSTTLTTDQQLRAEALALAQAELCEELTDAAGALSIAAAQAGEALPNMSAGAMAVVDQIEGLGIVSTQSAAEKAAHAGRGGLAHQAALKAAEDLDSLLSDTGPAMAGEGDLDGCFNLPRQRMQNAMNQMMAGMNAGVPSMGMQGGSGAGLSGSVAQMTMMGPKVPGSPGEGAADGARGDRRRGGPGRSATGHEMQETGDRPEHLRVDNTKGSIEGVAVRQGVPAAYREQAEAYFRRLAEESRVE